MTEQSKIKIDGAHIGEICTEVGERLRIATRCELTPPHLLLLVERLDVENREVPAKRLRV
jgi:hypothetical protein